MREKLQAAGYDMAAVPEAELEPGAERTPVTNALLHWARTLDDWRTRGQMARAEAHEALHLTLREWRQSEAARLRMAPASVLADHLLLKVALVKPREADSLLALGARVTAGGATAVIALISKWREEHAAAAEASQASSGTGGASSQAAGSSQARTGGAAMVMPAGTYQPKARWALANPPAGKKPPNWEASWKRFGGGESLEKIALTQENGKPIQPSTVLNHLMSALLQGRPMELQRLAQQAAAAQCSPPSQEEWDMLTSAEAAAVVDVAKVEKVAQTDLLKAFLPEAEKPYAERTEVEKEKLAAWYPKCTWFMAMRRVGLTPSFEQGGVAKKARIE